MEEKRRGYSTIQKQMEANKRWAEKNKEKKRYSTDRTTTRRFIRTKATLEDLQEIRQLADEREKTLADSSKSNGNE